MSKSSQNLTLIIFLSNFCHTQENIIASQKFHDLKCAILYSIANLAGDGLSNEIHLIRSNTEKIKIQITMT